MAIAQSLNDILFNDLPTKILVNDKEYGINYDFRTVLKIITALEDVNLYSEEKAAIMLDLLYKDEIPEEDIEEACEKASLFIDCGKYESNKKKEKRIYSFTKDGNYILTGINTTHNIDLSEKLNLHWWKFMALFMDMDNECFFSELIYFRKRKLEGKLTKEEKQQYKRIKDIVDLDTENIVEVQKMNSAKEKFLRELRR